MSSKNGTTSNAGANQAMRPATYALAAAVVVCVLGVVLNAAAPDLFAAVGGWVTVVIVFLAVAIWAGLAIVRRTNRNVARMEDDDSGAGR